MKHLFWVTKERINLSPEDLREISMEQLNRAITVLTNEKNKRITKQKEN